MRRGSSGRLLAVVAAVLFFAVLGVLLVRGDIPAVVPLVYVVLSAVAFVMYRVDKTAAVRRTRRTPESTLHTIALLGGWPGALVARPVFRHKTVKQPFRAVFWCTVAANLAALAWFVRA